MYARKRDELKRSDAVSFYEREVSEANIAILDVSNIYRVYVYSYTCILDVDWYVYETRNSLVESFDTDTPEFSTTIVKGSYRLSWKPISVENLII